MQGSLAGDEKVVISSSLLIYLCTCFKRPKAAGGMSGCHADKARRALCALHTGPLSESRGQRGEARTGDQGSKPGGYTWVDNMSLTLLMDCPTGAPADWHRAQLSSTG